MRAAVLLSFVIGLLLGAGILLALRSSGRESTAPEPRASHRSGVADLDASVSDLDLRESALRDALDRIAEQTGLNFDVRWSRLAEVGVGPETPVTARLRDVPAHAALRVVLLQADQETGEAAFIPQGPVVLITNATAVSRLCEVRVYDVRPLLPVDRPAFDRAAADLAELVTEFVEPLGWRVNGGTAGAIHAWNGRLVVEYTAPAHEQIVRFLADLQDPRPLPEPTLARADAGAVEWQVYDVSDLLMQADWPLASTTDYYAGRSGGGGGPGPSPQSPEESLRLIIELNVEPGSWNLHQGRVVSVWNGRLVIRHDPEVQREVLALLSQLRSPPGTQTGEVQP